MVSLKVLTCNARGLADKVKRKQVFLYVKSYNPVVVFFQETHSTKNAAKFWRSTWGANMYFAHGTNRAKGVAIALSRNLGEKVLEVKRDVQGRYLLLKLELDGQKFLFVNVYAPNEDDVDFHKELLEQVTQIGDIDQLVIGGDFNIYLDPKLDRKGGNPKMSQSASFVNEIMKELEWVDVWRELHPGKFQYTWKQRSPFIGTRLDYFLLPMSMLSMVNSCEILPGCNTDHLLVMLELESEITTKGPGFWKLNCSYLSDKKYVDDVNDIIDTHFEEDRKINPNWQYDEIGEFQSLDASLQWEMLKNKIVNFSKQFSRDKALVRKERITNAKSNLIKAEKKLAMINLSSDTATKFIQKANEKIDYHKRILDEEMRYRAQGALLRSKITWFQQGEHSNKYFLNLEKNRSKSKSMAATRRHDGTITRNIKEILQIQSEFYAKLYTTDPKVKFDATGINSPKLTEQQRISLDEPVTEQELGNAIAQMPRYKSPGIDGLPADFYKIFFVKLKGLLLKVYNDALQRGRLHSTARRGVITLLPKRGRDILLVKNYRPICLLCCDYKIISKVISHRIKGVLDGLIHLDQSGFVPGRNIATNIRKANDVIDHVTRKNISAVLISVDFTKAFDRVEYESLFGAFTHFGFGSKILSWLRMLFCDMELSTFSSGFTSPWTKPTRGLFQGNPLGPFGFVVLVELLAISLRQNKNIKGIKIGHVTHLLSQFADDLDLYLQFDQKVWEATMKTFEEFERISGMQINYEKTSVYRIGAIHGSNAKFYSAKRIAWTNEPINILGYWISHSEREMYQLNFLPLLEKAKNILSLWHHRGISIFGKILVINSLIASLFVYRITPTHYIPAEFIEKTRKLFTEFIWSGKKPKIKFSRLEQTRRQGGGGLVNMVKKIESLKLGWVFKLQERPDLQSLADDSLQNKVGMLLWESNLKESDVHELFPRDTFWRNLLIIWCRNNFRKPENKAEVKDEILWYNSLLRIDNKPVCYKKWLKAGITRIQDITTEAGQFLSHEQVQSTYNIKIPFTEYWGVILSIPEVWKEMLLQEDHGDCRETLQQLVSKKDSKTSFLYNDILQKDTGIFVSLANNWEKAGLQVSEEELKTANGKINKLTIAVKLRAFQFRLLHKAIVTNIYLKHCKIKETDLCTFCNNHRETVQHLMFECTYVKELITWTFKYGTERKTYKNWILSNLGTKLGDTISLIVKHYLYATRCSQEKPSLSSAKNYIKNIKELEKYVAISKNKYPSHLKKWHFITLD